MLKRDLIIFSLAIGAGSGTTMASAQAPAGAHMFLGRVAAQGGLEFVRTWDGATFYSGRCVNGCAEQHYLSVDVLSIGSDDQCASVIRHSVPRSFESTLHITTTWHPQNPPSDTTLDWRTITEVELVHTMIRLHGSFPNGVREATFRLTSPELASRTRAAMEDLRAACDPLADTGY